MAMVTKRALVVGSAALGLVSIGANPTSGAPPKYVAQTPATIAQLDPAVAGISSAKLVELSGEQAVYDVEINNPTASALDLTLHFKSQALALKASAKGKTTVSVTESAKDLSYDCQLVGRKVSFSLSGTGASTTVVTFEWTGTQVWTSSASVGTIGGAAALPDGPREVRAAAPATLERSFECGKRPKIQFKVDNQTAKALQGLKLRMLDVDGTVLGDEAVGTLGAGASKMMSIEATSPPKGIERYNSGDSLEVRIVDAAHELDARQITTEGFISYRWSAGPVSLKVSY